MEEEKKVKVIIKQPNFPELIRFIKKGSSIQELIGTIPPSRGKNIVSAILNNTYCDLGQRIFNNSRVHFIPLKSGMGLQTFSNTAVLILSYAITKLFKKNILNIGPSLHYNYYFDLQDDIPINMKLIKKIKKEFDDLVKADLLIKSCELPKNNAVRYFEKAGQNAKANLVKGLKDNEVRFYGIEDYYDICEGPIMARTGQVNKYKFISYPPGFLLEFPRVIKNKLKIIKPIHSKKLSKVFLETRDWEKVQGVSDVNQLNSVIRRNKISELINISEALHEKKISIIADEIKKKQKDIRIVLVAGPSSSGKTTFVKRLSIQLKVNGIRPVVISLDNYFRNREDTPRDKDGNYNFDCLGALDIELFNKNLKNLLAGQETELPVFDFYKKMRSEKTITLKLQEDQILLIEGIHGLNEKLTYTIKRKNKFKIYISAVSQLRISNNYRVGTRDARLFRRIVRDYNYRNSSAYDTLKMWPSVRKGEEQNIFPFQENADIIFNSALIYETAVLKPLVYKYLKAVPIHVPEFTDAQRLINILDYYYPAPSVNIPKISILREFIGGSAFDY